MHSWSQKDISEFINVLKKNTLQEVAQALYYHTEVGRVTNPQPTPTGSNEVIGYLEKLIEDHRVCVVDRVFPQMYGELRWLAARCLACEYAYKGIKTSIVLEDVMQPIREDRFNGLDDLEKRIQNRLIVTKTEVIQSQDWYELCCKEVIEERISKRDKE
ncbi:MAG: hypothetical protein AAFV93_12035 [Chloroflexota bacterium]